MSELDEKRQAKEALATAEAALKEKERAFAKRVRELEEAVRVAESTNEQKNAIILELQQREDAANNEAKQLYKQLHAREREKKRTSRNDREVELMKEQLRRSFEDAQRAVSSQRAAEEMLNKERLLFSEINNAEAALVQHTRVIGEETTQLRCLIREKDELIGRLEAEIRTERWLRSRNHDDDAAVPSEIEAERTSAGSRGSRGFGARERNVAGRGSSFGGNANEGGYEGAWASNSWRTRAATGRSGKENEQYLRLEEKGLPGAY